MRLAVRRVAAVTTTARLHFGFLDPSGRGKRPFGSFGLSLDRPTTRLTLERAEELRGERARARARLALSPRHRRKLGACDVLPAQVDEAIPPHAGLGSGTQLALAVGSAFAALEDLHLDVQEIATRLGRGARSGIGIATFAQGGVVLDSGPRQGGCRSLSAASPSPPIGACC